MLNEEEEEPKVPDDTFLTTTSARTQTRTLSGIRWPRILTKDAGARADPGAYHHQGGADRPLFLHSDERVYTAIEG